ncbi:MAG: HAMP domain-containing sensor histidine kinase [Christensenellaceae bacterium]|nr:HAMP domain-containing sensor histidine kinase [Christensenellaceae bacterium]
MTHVLLAALFLLTAAVCALLIKLCAMRRAADELSAAFAARLKDDTNVGIDISTGDRKLRALARDIDRALKDLRKARLRYEAGDRGLTEAVTNISHDLRTPLAAICGHLELLRRAELPEEVRAQLNIIENRAEALKALTEELFRYSVVRSTDFSGERERVSLNQAIEECVADHYHALRGRNMEPVISLPETPVERMMNRAALARVLGNVMGNAVKYSGGDLRIALSKDGVILFSNRAEGLDEVSVRRLFERFYTIETGRGGGTGLGLSIARALTDQLGGTIDASAAGGVLSVEICFPGSND